MPMRRRALGLCLLAAALFSSAEAYAQCGRASWYALKSRTASGEMMNPAAMTAAHRTLPFGTKVTVRNQRNGKAVTVRQTRTLAPSGDEMTVQTNVAIHHGYSHGEALPESEAQDVYVRAPG